MAHVIERSIKCPWCGKFAIQSGPQRFGFGINVLTYVCRSCNAMTVSSRDSHKEIESINMTYTFKED